MLLINYATKGRPEKFRSAIRNIYDTIGTSNDNFKVFVKVNDGDTSMTGQDIKDWAAQYPNMEIVPCAVNDKISAINYGVTEQSWDWIINMSDDMEWVVPNWYNRILAFVSGDIWFLHLNDGHVGSALPTMSIMSRDYYDIDGYVYYPEYKTESCDAEAMYVAMMREKHIYKEDCFFVHRHPANSSQHNTDATYEHNNQFRNADYQLYFRRLVDYFGIESPEQRKLLPINPDDYRERIIPQ